MFDIFVSKVKFAYRRIFVAELRQFFYGTGGRGIGFYVGDNLVIGYTAVIGNPFKAVLGIIGFACGNYHGAYGAFLKHCPFSYRRRQRIKRPFDAYAL